jgi:hypothetical protein
MNVPRSTSRETPRTDDQLEELEPDDFVNEAAQPLPTNNANSTGR